MHFVGVFLDELGRPDGFVVTPAALATSFVSIRLSDADFLFSHDRGFRFFFPCQQSGLRPTPIPPWQTLQIRLPNWLRMITDA